MQARARTQRIVCTDGCEYNTLKCIKWFAVCYLSSFPFCVFHSLNTLTQTHTSNFDLTTAAIPYYFSSSLDFNGETILNANFGQISVIDTKYIWNNLHHIAYWSSLRLKMSDKQIEREREREKEGGGGDWNWAIKTTHLNISQFSCELKIWLPKHTCGERVCVCVYDH